MSLIVALPNKYYLPLIRIYPIGNNHWYDIIMLLNVDCLFIGKNILDYYHSKDLFFRLWLLLLHYFNQYLQAVKSHEKD